MFKYSKLLEMPTKSKIEKDLKFSITIKKQKNFYLNQAAILRGCRAVAKLTQREAAVKLEISAATLCGWEQKGCRDLAHCSRLAALYGQEITLFIPSTYDN